MFDAPRDSVLAILADFGPSLLVVAPFLPALLLAVALLALSIRPAPAPLPTMGLTAIPNRRRQLGLRDRPELALAGLVLAVALTTLAAFRGFHA